LAVLQFACPYCTGMFQVDPSMAGSEAMCPMCHGVIVVPSDPSDPPAAEDQFAGQYEPAGEEFDFNFGRKKRRPTFEGLGESSPESQFADYDAAALHSMACPHCGSPFQVEASLAGQQAMCPTCQGVVVIPDVNASQFPSAPPAPAFDPYAPVGAPPSMPQPLMPQIPAPQLAALPPEVPGYVPPSTDYAPAFLVPPSTPQPTQQVPVQSPRPGPMPAPTSNPLPPGFGGPPIETPGPQPFQSTPPLSARATPAADVPLSTRQSVDSSGSGIGPQSGADAKSAINALLPPASASSAPTPILPKSVSAAETLRPIPIPSESTLHPSEKKRDDKPQSRAAKVEAMLPEAAAPDEEVVAERPIAVEEPPGEEFGALAVGLNQQATVTDADGEPIRRKTAEERAKLRRIRTTLLFAVGMLILVIAAVVLPRMGYVIDIGKDQQKGAK
jgi:hypothetical protein